MSEEMIIRHCSPTLAGIKTGNIFTCEFKSKDDLYQSIRNINRRLLGKGIRAVPLRYKNDRAIIYIYRPSMLSEDLNHECAYRILSERGYSICTPQRCIQGLVRRLNENDEFPHEIGLFLGYPPEDVSGFIENNAGGFILVGYWKVYGDKEKAIKIFKKYKKCTDIYCKCHAEGKSLERLTIPVSI